MDTKTGIIIQARYSSTRLPGKLFMPFYKEKRMIDLFLENIADDVNNRYDIILATSVNKNDDVFTGVAKKHGIKLFRGSENDVLDRMISAAKTNGISTIIRVCADNPVYDINGTLSLLESHKKGGNDYTSFSMDEGLPSIKSHIGLWGEIVELSALEKAFSLTDEKFYHEHVTNYIYGNPDKFKIELHKAPYNLYKRKELRLTVDDIVDFELMKNIYKTYVENRGEKVDILKMIELIDKNDNFKPVMKEQITKYKK